jgi:hypothetical protein
MSNKPSVYLGQQGTLLSWNTVTYYVNSIASPRLQKRKQQTPSPKMHPMPPIYSDEKFPFHQPQFHFHSPSISSFPEASASLLVFCFFRGTLSLSQSPSQIGRFRSHLPSLIPLTLISWGTTYLSYLVFAKTNVTEPKIDA